MKIVSGGLEIREFRPLDADQIAAFLTAGDRTALPPSAPHDVGDVADWVTEAVHRHRLSGGGVHLVIAREDTGEIVGSIGLRAVDWDAGTSELGYGVHAGHRGRGYATEGSRCLVDLGFRQFGARRVVAETMVVNVASRRVMEKIGLRQIRTFHQ